MCVTKYGMVSLVGRGQRKTEPRIHDTTHLCRRLRTDGIKIMSHSFSGGKQVIQFANAINRGRVCLSCEQKMKNFLA